MTIGAQVVQPQPTAIVDNGRGDKNASRCPPYADAGSSGAWGRVAPEAAIGDGVASRSHRAQGGRWVRPANDLGSWSVASGWLGWHDRLVRGNGAIGPQPAEHQEDAYQRHETELVEKEGGYHGNAPADNGVRGIL